MKPLLVILPFHRGDFDATLRLLEWIRDLGGEREFPLMLLGAKSVLNVEMLRLKELAVQCFGQVYTERSPGLPDEHWPIGPNLMFRHASERVYTHYKSPFLWMEPDCVPMKQGWLEAIQNEYATCQGQFMGNVRRQTSNPSLPEVYLPGCSVYPVDAYPLLRDHWGSLTTAWDVATACVSVGRARKSNLFYEWWGMNGKPPTFKVERKDTDPINVMVPRQIPDKAVFYHRCKDGSLVKCLRQLLKVNGEKSTTGKPLMSFFHSGDLGDIIYSLLFASRFGEIALFLGPDKRYTLRQQMSPEIFRWLEPLLRAQPWIRSVEFRESVPLVNFNLNDFRRTWFNPNFGHAKRRRLFETYAEHFKQPPLPENVAWLSVDPISDPQRPVVIARSPRFHNVNFPWQVVSNNYAGRMRFVGHKDEYEDWTKRFGQTSEYVPVKNALELAQIIAGAELFIGNQSFPMSLALALNVPVVQETCLGTPDCIFHRPNAIYSDKNQVRLPDLKPHKFRFVSNKPNAEGLIELGPQINAFGLGDTLTVTPLAERLGNKSIMCLPPSIERFAPLFHGLCPTKITEDAPVFPNTGKRFIESKLMQFGFTDFTPGTVLPIFRLTDSEIKQGTEWLAEQNPDKPPLVVHTNCVKIWSHVRSRPPEFFHPILDVLRQSFAIVEIPDETDLRMLAAYYRAVGRYFGVNTGNWHLAAAVGCRCLVMDSEPVPGYDPSLWRYTVPQIRYSGFDQKNIIEAIPWLLQPND